MKPFTLKTLTGLLMSVGLLPLLIGCAPGVNIFKSGSWGIFLVLAITIAIGAFVIRRISNSGAEHKS